jgi:hypothetical protein
MQRLVQPELLDHLPGDHPDSMRSHRDLKRIHAWMGNTRTIASCLDHAARREFPRRIIDLGAGDGALLLRSVRRTKRLPQGTKLVLIDRRQSVDPAVVESLRRRGFAVSIEKVDALAWLQSATPQSGTWFLASLFLHHFDTSALRILLSKVAQHADLLCACEPRRAGLPLVASQLLPLIGASAITRHDARISVRAGFRERELSALWPASDAWRLEERSAGLFSHMFSAKRRSAE